MTTYQTAIDAVRELKQNSATLGQTLAQKMLLVCNFKTVSKQV
ncbi:isocitrate lyase domain protein [Acinetobacter baumannii 73736]|nr:isocitrate lyase domain protein [Acinetobacter baumannii 73736]